MNRSITSILPTLCSLSLLFAFAQTSVQASTITVTTNVPDIADDGKCSLIEAIDNANSGAVHANCVAGTAGPNVIELPVNSTHTLTVGFGIVAGDLPPPNGLPIVTSDITIEGHGSTIRRDPADTDVFRIIEIGGNGKLTLNQLTVSGGESDAGGGIFNNEGGTLTMNQCTLSGNRGRGAGIFNFGGTVNLNHSTVSGNNANLGRDGGGVFNHNGGKVTLTHCTVSGNHADNEAGGVFNFAGNVTLSRSLIVGNTALVGAEMSKLSNAPPFAADDFNVLGHSGLNNKQALNGFTVAPGTSDIIATSDGNNPKSLTAILDVTLSFNGGFTQTHALVPGSPAVDPPGACTTAAPDQRGEARPQGPTCDIGAFELRQNVSPCQGQTPTKVGTPGDDIITGTDGVDVIKGLGGNDKIRGLKGNDLICGGGGDDTLLGGAGDDSLKGGNGADTLKGGGGADICNGGLGDADTADVNCETVVNIP